MASGSIKTTRHPMRYYNPSIYANGSGEITIERSDCNYVVTEDFLFLSGRFHLLTTNGGNGNICIPYPSGVTCGNAGVGIVGYVGLAAAHPIQALSIRANDSDFCYVQYGAGNYSVPAIGADTWVLYNALIPR